MLTNTRRTGIPGDTLTSQNVVIAHSAYFVISRTVTVDGALHVCYINKNTAALWDITVQKYDSNHGDDEKEVTGWSL